MSPSARASTSASARRWRKLEAQVAFETLARRVGAFELADDPSYRENFVLRGLARLPIAFDNN